MKSMAIGILALVFITTGLSLLGHDAYMGAKAATASRLIESAWQKHRLDGQEHRPWQWADFSPIGQIEIPGLGISRPVLSDASGQSMAFGLGHVPGTAQPGDWGNIVLAGHRDSHAEFMSLVNNGDTVILYDGEGSTSYQIMGSVIVDADDTAVLTQDGPDRLTLVTCYPFGGLTPTDKRYVLTGFRIPEPDTNDSSSMAMMMSF
jgi:sortase A